MITVYLTGQLIFFPDGKRLTVSVPELDSDNHFLKLSLFEQGSNPELKWEHFGPLPYDLWFDSTPDEQVKYRRVIGPSGPIPPDPTDLENIGWLLNLDGPLLHDNKPTLQYNKAKLSKSFHFTRGEIYTSRRTDPGAFEVIRPTPPTPPPTSPPTSPPQYPTLVSMATEIGIEIPTGKEIRDIIMRVSWGNGKSALPSDVSLNSKNYFFNIENNPPIGAKPDALDYKNYYQVIQNLAPSQYFDIGPVVNGAGPGTDDLPCMPVGGGCPPMGP